MKNNRFLGLIILLFALTTFSCSNLFEQNLEKEEPAAESNSAFIKISLSDSSSRTVLPTADSGFTDIVLRAGYTYQHYSKAKIYGQWASESDMQSSSIAIPTGKWGIWVFAKKGGSNLIGYIEKNIIVGENNLSFNMQIEETETGAGSFTITLDFSAAGDKDKVSYAKAKLENLDGSAVEGVEEQTLTPSENKVVFTASSLPVGTYRARVAFYTSTNLELATYRELVQISSDLTSSATRNIESFDNLYTITYNNINGATLPEGTSLPQTVTRKSTAITLPSLTRNYYTFGGWFTDENCSDANKITEIASVTDNITVWAKFTPITYTITYVLNGGTLPDGAVTSYTPVDDVTLPIPSYDDKPFYGWYEVEDFKGNIITGWKKDEKAGNITLYANFEYLIVTPDNIDSIVNQVDSMTQDINVKVIGEFDGESIKKIPTLLYNATNKEYPYSTKRIFVSLDLSESSGYYYYNCYRWNYPSLRSIVLSDCFTQIPCDLVQGAENLKEITFPSTITKFDKYTFNGCSSLETVTIPNSITEIPDNCFENCTSLSTITIGKKTEKIGASAFSGCKSLTTITIPSNVTDIGQYAFKGTGLTSAILNTKKNMKWCYGYVDSGRDDFNYEDASYAAYMFKTFSSQIYFQYRKQ